MLAVDVVGEEAYRCTVQTLNRMPYPFRLLSILKKTITKITPITLFTLTRPSTQLGSGWVSESRQCSLNTTEPSERISRQSEYLSEKVLKSKLY